MDAAHTIRLHGPWTCLLLDTPDPSSQPQKFHAPHGLSALLGDRFAGRVRLERTFHRPTGLDDWLEVILSVTTTHLGRFALNGNQCDLASDGTHRHLITHWLERRNQLVIELVIDCEPPMRQPSCDVQLEIVTQDRER